MNDETLTLYYYNDGLSRAERQQVANKLATDPDAARRYQEICRELDELAAPPITAPPSDMVARWHENLDRAIRAKVATTRKPVFHTWSFIWGTAITAALAVGIGIGLHFSGNKASQVTTPNAVAAVDPGSNAFLRGLRVHLRESEQGLVATPLDSSTDRTMLIMDIIEQNRLFERVARQHQSDGLARLLRSFELVLVRLASDDITPQEAEALQTKLLFELNVVLTKLAHEPSDESEVI